MAVEEASYHHVSLVMAHSLSFVYLLSYASSGRRDNFIPDKNINNAKQCRWLKEINIKVNNGIVTHLCRRKQKLGHPKDTSSKHVWGIHHYNDVIMGAIASQITNLTIVFSTIYLDTDQRKHQSSATLAIVRGIHRRPVNSPHKWPVTRKMFPFDDVIMTVLLSCSNDGAVCFREVYIRCYVNLP